MNNKGQALIEFVLIMPVIIFIIIALIDVGNIYLEKYELTDDLETITDLYQNDQKKEALAYAATKDITVTEDSNNNLLTITLSKDIDINAPILKNVLNDYTIEADKTIYEDLHE